jgi:hypothetical protein
MDKLNCMVKKCFTLKKIQSQKNNTFWYPIRQQNTDMAALLIFAEAKLPVT